MKFFRSSRVQFSNHDPLDDGLGDQIANEQRESGIDLYDNDGQSLADFWDGVSKHLKDDPTWFDSNKND